MRASALANNLAIRARGGWFHRFFRAPQQRLSLQQRLQIILPWRRWLSRGAIEVPDLGQLVSHPISIRGVDLGACSLTDKTAIMAHGEGNDVGSWAKICSDCAHASLNILRGIHQENFNRCLTNHVTISKTCSTCFADAAQYVYDHCKLACLKSQWSDSCLKCVAGFDIKECTGFEVPKVSSHGNSVASQTVENKAVLAFPTSCSKIVAILIGLLVGGGVSFLAIRLRHAAPVVRKHLHAKCWFEA